MNGTKAANSESAIRIGWTTRYVPRPPTAVVAETRDIAAALLRSILAQPDSTLAHWSGVVAPSSGMVALIALKPDATPLPWIDGVRYLGRDSDAPTTLFLPTNLRPSVPAVLLYRALRLKNPEIQEPIAVFPSSSTDDLVLLSLAEARALGRETVAEAYHGFVTATAQAAQRPL